MNVRRVDPSNIDKEVIAEAAEVIRRGGLVAFPTETVYGLGADATNAKAIEKIFTAKGRPSYNPLIVHAADLAGAQNCVTAWPESAQKLAARFWPGPLTMVLPKHSSIPDVATAGLSTVGIRVPAHAVARALIEAARTPIAAPSANRSMHISPTEGPHVSASLGAAPDLILDAGPATVGIESTVIDLTGDIPTVLRPGMISTDELRELLDRVELATTAVEGAARPSPGMMDRHYSPQAKLVLASDVEAATDAAGREARRGESVVVLSRTNITSAAFTVWPMPHTAPDYARALYGMLHRADAEKFTVIVVEAVPDGASWDGVRDRLRRAAR
jgi:L-threonylcarbamoyladenylate synthase